MGSINAWVSSFLTVDYHTEAAATTIKEYLDGKDGKRLALIGYDYTAAATAHVMSIMFPGAAAGCRNTVDGGAAITQKVIDVNTAPVDPAGNAVAASDVVAYKVTGNTWEWNTVASLATKAVTHATNVAVAILDGAAYMVFGIPADGARAIQALPASVTTSRYAGIYFTAPQKGDPIHISIDNATNAGFLNAMTWAFINK